MKAKGRTERLIPHVALHVKLYLHRVVAHEGWKFAEDVEDLRVAVERTEAFWNLIIVPKYFISDDICTLTLTVRSRIEGWVELYLRDWNLK